MVYLAIRLVGLLVLAVMSAANDESVIDNLSAWDGQWYLEIAENGYAGVDPGMVDGHGNRSDETPLAFFPGYPVLIALAKVLTGMNAFGAAVTVSLVAGVTCAYALARLGTMVGGTRTVGLLMVVLFAAAPMSVVLSMPYSEALFCALSAWALVGVVERRWLLAAVCCAGAGLIRPTAAALIAVVCLAAAVSMIKRREFRGPLLTLLVAPSGMLCYLGWVATRTGSVNGYFELQQRGWSSAFDGGGATGKFVLDTLAAERSAFETVTVWIVLWSLVAFAMCLRDRIPWPLIAFAGTVLLLDLGSDGLMYSKVRLMLPAFVLLLPIAMGLAQRRTATAVLTSIGFVLFGSWFGAYALTAWQYAI